MFFVLLIQAAMIGMLCSYVAGQKNRDGTSWFFLGFLFSLFALLALIAIPSLPEDKKPSQPVNDPVSMPTTRKCPICAEEIKIEALKCKHCGSTFDPYDVEKYIMKFKDDFKQRLTDEFKLVSDQNGEALCIACRKVSPMNGMYHHKGTDTYYHANCLPSSDSNSQKATDSSNAIPSLSGDYKKCPTCAELIKFEALKCKHCGTEFNQSDVDLEKKKRIKAKTDSLSNYKLISGEKGEAFCIICRKVSPMNGMYKLVGTETYYHSGCLPKIEE
jgi:hypothetical protein